MNDKQMIYGISADLIAESYKENGIEGWRLKGNFATIDKKNRNGRTYKREDWDREVKRFNKYIAEGSINTLMEFEHPNSSKINPQRAVGKVYKLEIRGNYVYGEAIMFNTELAKPIIEMIRTGVKVGISSRGTGNVNNGQVSDFELICFDVVAYPSDEAANLNGLYESEEEKTEYNNIYNIEAHCKNLCEYVDLLRFLHDETFISNKGKNMSESTLATLAELESKVYSLADALKASSPTQYNLQDDEGYTRFEMFNQDIGNVNSEWDGQHHAITDKEISSVLGV